MIAARHFGEQPRSNLFNKAVIPQARDHPEDGVHEQKRSNLFSQNAYGQLMKHQGGAKTHSRGDYVKSEVIYSYDLD